jgi:hypothetical protein
MQSEFNITLPFCGDGNGVYGSEAILFRIQIHSKIVMNRFNRF